LKNNPALSTALARYQSLLSPQEFSRLLVELERPLPPAIRINPLKIDPLPDLGFQEALNPPASTPVAFRAVVEDWSARYSWQVQPVPFCPAGWQIVESPIPPSQTIEHRLGQYYIQDAASMLPVELFDFKDLEQPLVLDLAASPGGKTTHLVSRTADRGLVLANDSAQGRITALRLVLQAWGSTSTAVTCFPGESFGVWFPETFDRVLLDAPCSMENLRPTISHPMRPISAKERQSLAQRQGRLLVGAFQALKVGGQLVYSTCTLAPEEDEQVLEGLLRRFPGTFEIEDLSGRLPHPAPGLSSDGSRTFDPAVTRSARLWPHRFGTSGFFAALVNKKEQVEAPALPAPFRSLAKTGLQALASRQVNFLAAQLRDDFGFELVPLLETQRLSLWSRGQQIYALPELFLKRFSGLPFQAVGLLAGETAPEGGFNPSHEWVARFASRFKSGRYPLSEELLPAWLRGEDLRGLPTRGYPPGRMVIVEDSAGRLLGRGRVLADRLKNLLPRRLAGF